MNWHRLPELRDSARVVVMDNFGIFPSVEEQIDFVDQSGYLFGPNMATTINHIPVVLHWWREESRYVDGESMLDVVTYICNKLIPTLIKHRSIDLAERKRKAELDDKNKSKPKPEELKSDNIQPTSFTNSPNIENITNITEPQRLADDGKYTKKIFKNYYDQMIQYSNFY